VEFREAHAIREFAQSETPLNVGVENIVRYTTAITMQRREECCDEITIAARPMRQVIDYSAERTGGVESGLRLARLSVIHHAP